MHLPTPCKHSDKETARDLMVAYTAGACSPAEKVDFELHCLSCDECLTTLAIILRLLRFPVDEEEDKTLALLYTIGMEAARVARQEVGMEAPTSLIGTAIREIDNRGNVKQYCRALSD